MAGIDFKKEYRELYSPKGQPQMIDVPEMLFIMVDGKGDPNHSKAYQEAMDILYGLSYTIKMSPKSGATPEGYYEYVVPPLEGLWWMADGSEFDVAKPGEKEKLCWTSMIRQPLFVTQEVFENAKKALAKKKPEMSVESARLCIYTEGLCVQMMHTGPYDDEPATIAQMKDYLAVEGFALDLSHARRHHEIYLSDPHKTAPEKLKTVIRYPVSR